MRSFGAQVLLYLTITTATFNGITILDMGASDMISVLMRARLSDPDWESLHSIIESFRKGLDGLSFQTRYGSTNAIMESLSVVMYETLYFYLARSDLDHAHMAYLDPLIRLYWDHFISDQVALSHARNIAELIAASLFETQSIYNETEMEDLSYALPVKGHPEFIRYVAMSRPESSPTRSVVPQFTKEDPCLFELAHRMILRLREHIQREESRVDIASIFSSVLYVYDSVVAVGDEETAGEHLTNFCSEESDFINELVHDLAGSYTVRQRVSLERFCFHSLSLKVRFISLFLPYVKQSYMVAPYMRDRTRIWLEKHVDDVEANLVALTRLSREELLAGNLVVTYKWTIFGFERMRSLDEETWMDRLVPKLLSDREWFDKNAIPRPDVFRPDLFVGAGKLIGLAIIRERLAIDVDPTILTRLLLPASDDEYFEKDEANHAINAFVYGIFSIIPRDAFERFFNNEMELQKMFSGKLYEIGERGQV